MKALPKSMNSISFRIPAMTVAVMVIVASTIAFFAYQSAKAGLLREANERLQSVTHTRATQLEEWFAELELDITVTASNPTFLNGLKMFSVGFDEFDDNGATLQARYIDNNANKVGEKSLLDDAGDTSRFTGSHKILHPYFRDFIELYGYYDLFLIDDEGNIVYTVTKERDFGSNLIDGPWANTGLAQAYRQTLMTGKPAISDIDRYGPSADAPAGFVAQAIKDKDGFIKGAIAFQIATDEIEAMLQAPAGLGQTGHSFLVGKDGRRRTSSRFEGGPEILTDVVISEHIAAALAGESGIFPDVTGEDGDTAYGIVQPFTYGGLTWAIIVEQDHDEVFQETISMRNTIAIELAIAALIATLISTIAARSMTRPMLRIAESMNVVSSGDYSAEIPGVSRGDEVGSMARNLKSLQDALEAGQEERRVALYKSAAFEGSSSANMMVDKDLNIIFVNPSTIKLMREIQDEMRKVWPDFDPDGLVGSNIDRFHRNPAHQRQLLADPSRMPHKSDITVGDIKIELNVTMIRDEQGNYAGNILEWQNVTDLRLNEGTLAAIRSHQLVSVFNAEGHLLDANDGYFDRYGHARSDIIGLGQTQLHKMHVVAAPEDWARVKSGETVTGRFERMNRDGQPLIVEGSLTPVKDRSGKLFRIVEITSDVTDSELSGREARARNKAIEEATQHVVSELRRGLGALADGDLSHSIDAPFAEEYEQLRADFNGTIISLREAVMTLTENASSIRSGASEISQAADDLSRRTEGQAATLEETAAALDELTASVKSAADGAQSADTAMQDARTEAEASGEVVRQAVSAMEQIQKSSDQISQIIGVIDDIAFQTNLLALNAGVEAARAGEAGRGFAVVASEVRALAQRSSEAAKEIKTLISTSSEQVDRGVGLVGKAGDALSKIVSSVTEISALVTNIAASSKEQAIGISEINNGVNQLDQVTQQNAAMVEESTAASHALRSEANALGEIVARFRLGDAVVAAPAAPARAKITKTHSENASDAAPPPKVAASGGGAAAAGVWQDF